jgi:hypothetical protein
VVAVVTRQVDQLQRACAALGIPMEAPYSLQLESGRRVDAAALVIGIGAPKGTLVFGNAEGLMNSLAELKAAGFTASSWDEPSEDEEFDLASYREMFEEWGWDPNEGQP